MAIWRDGIEGHPLFQALTAAQATIDGIAGVEDAEQLAFLSRVRAVVSSARAAISAADPQLVADATLDRIVPEANQIRDSAAAFTEGHDPAHLSAMDSNASTLLDELGLGAFLNPEVVDALRDNLTRYRRAGRQLVEDLESDVATARDQAATVTARLAALDATIAEEVSKVGAEVVAKIAPVDARVSELAEKLAVETARVSTLLTNQTKSFEDATAEQQAAFLKFMSEREERLNRAETTASNAAKSQRTQIQKSADEVLERLLAKEEEARKVVSSVGALGITGGFGEYAFQQKQRADRWNIATVVALVIATIPGAVYFLSVTLGGQQPVDLERFLERIVTGGPLYVIAGYAAIQGARSRDNERWARAKELELAAIGPYLALLSETERNAVLIELAPKYFGQPAGHKAGDEGIAAARIVKAVEDTGKS